MKFTLFSIFVCLSFCVAAFGQQKTVAAKKIYQNIQVETFNVKPNVDFPADQVQPLSDAVVRSLTKSKRFSATLLNAKSPTAAAAQTPTDATAAIETPIASATPTTTAAPNETAAANGSTLKLTGEIVDFKKGNRAARYFVGFGVGATKIIVNVKFTDAATGEVVHEQIVDGVVSVGFFGGDSDGAKGGVAGEITKVAKKKFAAAKK